MKFRGNGVFILFWLLFGAISTEGRNFYLSKWSGDDDWPCDFLKPCKTIRRAVSVASRGDYIYLNGKNTDKDPYSCQSGKFGDPGIYINKSLSIIGYGNPKPQIRCSEDTWLIFSGSQARQEMNVTLLRLFLNESIVIFQDTSADINNCEFEGMKHGVKFEKTNTVVSTIQIANCTFSKNEHCISFVVNGAKGAISRQNIPVAFKLRDSVLSGNVLANDSTCISFTESCDNYLSVIGDISLENVTFKDNKFSLKGLVFQKISDGNQTIHFREVLSVGNTPLSDSDNSQGEYIVQSTAAKIFINSSKFLSSRKYNFRGIYNSRRPFAINASSVLLQVFNSTFLGYQYESTVRESGGAIFVSCRKFCKINISDSSFVNTSADQGGAIFVECLGASSITLRNSNFIGNIARSQSGGAVYVSSVAEHSCSLEEEADIRHQTQSEQRLEINITQCIFRNGFGLNGGGALYIKAVNGFIYVRQSYFTSCHAHWLGGGAVFFTASFTCKLRANDKLIFIVENSTFSDNAVLYDGAALYIDGKYQEIVIFREVFMARNRAYKGHGGAVYSPQLSTLKIYKSRFRKNKGPTVFLANTKVFELYDSFVEGSDTYSAWTGLYGAALNINISISLLIINTTFKNCRAMEMGGTIYLLTESCASVKIRTSRFVENYPHIGGGLVTYGGAIFLRQLRSTKWHRECEGKGFLQTESSVCSSQKWGLVVEDTVFDKNAAFIGGAVFLAFMENGALFRNCTFKDNFASFGGGHIYAAFGSVDLVIEDSVFRQTLNDLEYFQARYTKGSFLHVENLRELKLSNTLMDVNSSSYRNLSVNVSPIMLFRNVRVTNLENKNNRFYCPVGSSMHILHFTFSLHFRPENASETYEFSCSSCSENSYSLQRGYALGTHVEPGFKCLPCPFGANCTENIISQQNFWGFKEHGNPPTLRFILCPLGYCRSPSKINLFTEYNDCQGNRSGELCGHCREGYTETLYSTKCRPSDECNDYWFWPLVLLYVSLMALYFTFSPPFVSWIYRQIIWCQVATPANLQDYDKGYIKIVFYFYQAANLLVITSSKDYVKTRVVEPLIGLFNFQQKISSNGFICPFPGLTVVTKQLFYSSYVFGTLITICALYIFHWVVRKCRSQGAPCFGPYIGGILRTLLLGYTTLASVIFSVLRCVPIGTESRLFLDGNIACLQWWQYILIAFAFCFIGPFVVVLYWGSSMLYNKKISVASFLLACCLPLPCLLYWIFTALFRWERDAVLGNLSSIELSRYYVERVLYDSFKRDENGRKMSLSWESVMIGRRLTLILLVTYVSDLMLSRVLMSLFCVLFLLHHSTTKPFRDSMVNRLETISLLSLVVLAILNVFFASFISLAVPLNDHFIIWWNVCQYGQMIILLVAPAVFSFLVVAAVFSQIGRFVYVVCHTFYRLCRFCWGWCFARRGDEMRPILSQSTDR